MNCINHISKTDNIQKGRSEDDTRGRGVEDCLFVSCHQCDNRNEKVKEGFKAIWGTFHVLVLKQAY